MKIKNLLLGSVTAAGLMTGAAYAADLGVLTSVDVCDQLGISGLTISSETNCLKISGEVSYNFDYGVWQTSVSATGGFYLPNGHASWGYALVSDDAQILKSEVKAKLNFEATADSSFGPAKAVIKLVADYVDGIESNPVNVDEAYVSIGEGTVIMAGHKGSVFNNGDDAPLNWLGLFNSDAVNTGVDTTGDYPGTSNAIQITHDLGNGFSIAGGLEELDANGVAVGVLAYSGDNISAHASVVAYDVLENDGAPGNGGWDLHAGVAATLDSIKLVAALATDSNSNWSVLGSAEATFDMFSIAGSVEATESEYTGAGASLTAEVSEGVKLNVGGRWNEYYGDTAYEIAVGAEAAVAENLTLSGAIGYVNETDGYDSTITYGWAKLAWAPGGGFTASVKGTVSTSTGENYETIVDSEELGTAYKIETEFKKTFE